MAVTDTWDESNPPDAQNPNLGDDRIREFKRQVRERLDNGDHYINPGALDTDEGKHVLGEAGVAGVLNIFESNAHAGNRTTAAASIRDGAAATKTDTLELGDGVDSVRPYTVEAWIGKFDRLNVVGTAANSAIPAGLVQNGEGTNDIGATTLTGSFAAVGSDAITTKAGTAGPVVIHMNPIVVRNSVTGTTGFDFQLKRDSTILRTWTNGLSIDAGDAAIRMAFPILWFDTGATAATAHTYSLEARFTGAGTGHSVAAGWSIVLMELRND